MTNLSPTEVVIVDDTSEDLQLMEEYLNRGPYTLRLFSQSSIAFESVCQNPPDLLLLDVKMPELDGLTFLKRLQEYHDSFSFPVIVISFMDDLGTVVQCIEKGAEDYLVKPVNPVFLRAKIKSCLKKKQLQDQERDMRQELEENYRALQELERGRDMLTKMIVHDLNNHLTSVFGYLDLLLLEAREQETMGAFIKDLEQVYLAGYQMSMMVQSIMDMTRFEEKGPSIKLSEFEALEVVQQQVRLTSPLSKKKNIHVELTLPGEPVVVKGNSLYLVRVLQNLLNNAVTNSPPAFRIECSAEVLGRDVKFSVKDEGPGIPAEFHKNIFDKYFQVEDKKMRKNLGVGLGLSFCKLAVEGMGGEIWVESEVGEGAEFHFTLPLA